MIRVEKLVKRYGATAVVDQVSFEAGEGSFIALLGPSGGGKSTVLRIIAGLEHPDEGRVIVGERDVTDMRVQERGLGFVFQHYALFRHMTVRQNIAFGLEVRKQAPKEIVSRVDELLELVQLQAMGDRFPSQLSGGQKQRVALARALAPRPSMLLLDEPFGALDAKVRLELRRWLQKLQRDQKITTIFVTHDQDEAMDLADEIVIIQAGKVEQIGSPAEVYDKPKTAFVASFMGSSNMLRGRVDKGRAALGRVDLPLSAGTREGAGVQAFVRHHQVQVLGKADGDSSDTAARAKLVRVVRVGGAVRLELEFDDGQSLVSEVLKERYDALALSIGDELALSFGEASVFVDDYVI